MGGGLQRVLGYLKTLLPVDDGFVSARAMYSVDSDDLTHLAFESTWEHWEDLQAHMQSQLSERKILNEFEPHVALENLETRVFAEVG